MTHSMRQLALPFAHRTDFVHTPFLRLPGNATAAGWLERPDSWPLHRLVLWGEPGTGKSHLAARWATRQGIGVTPGATLRWPAPDLPHAIDDADQAPSEPLLHLLNWSAEQRRPVLMTGRPPPSQWHGALADLHSRLAATTSVPLKADEALLPLLLSRLLVDRQIVVAKPLQEALLLHLPRSPAAIREAAARLDEHALSTGGRVTRATVSAVIDEIAALWQAGPS